MMKFYPVWSREIEYSCDTVKLKDCQTVQGKT